MVTVHPVSEPGVIQTVRTLSDMTRSHTPYSQTLMIDADDTLWENNVLFDRAIQNFIQLVAHPVLDDKEIRAAFNQLEHARVQVHGYGAESFRRSMLASFEDLLSRPPSPSEQERIAGFAHSILSAKIDLLDGVAEVLPILAAKHRLILVTKGNLQEQTSKLERSGLAACFHHVEVLPEKHVDAYHSLRAKHGCEAGSTWMIGNSPKSDINPALAAGLHAIFVPHHNTWVLEDEPLAIPVPLQQLLEISSFRALPGLFEQRPTMVYSTSD